MQTEMMMKKRRLRCAGVLMGVWLTGNVWATSTAELRVLGVMKKPGCTVMAPNGGVYALGRIARTANATLPAVTQTWQVRCDRDTAVVVMATDNRAATRSQTGATHFGLGSSADGRSLGYFQLGVSNARLAMQPVTLGLPGDSATAGAMRFLPAGKRVAWAGSDGLRRSARDYRVDLTVLPVLQWANVPTDMPVSLDGSVTLDFVFGL